MADADTTPASLPADDQLVGSRGFPPTMTVLAPLLGEPKLESTSQYLNRTASERNKPRCATLAVPEMSLASYPLFA
jgi:hypothetical protein